MTIEKNNRLLEGVDSLTGYYYKEELNPLSKSEILAKFKDRTPAIVKGSYGEGETILFGSLMDLSYLNSVNNSFKKLIHNISKLADVPSVVKITYPKERSVRTRVLSSDKTI